MVSVVAAMVAVRVAAGGRDARRARAPLATRVAHSSSKASRSEEIRHVAHRVLHDSEPLVTQHVAHAREGPVAIHLAYAGARRLNVAEHAPVPLGEDGIARRARDERRVVGHAKGRVVGLRVQCAIVEAGE